MITAGLLLLKNLPEDELSKAMANAYQFRTMPSFTHADAIEPVRNLPKQIKDGVAKIEDVDKETRAKAKKK